MAWLGIWFPSPRAVAACGKTPSPHPVLRPVSTRCRKALKKGKKKVAAFEWPWGNCPHPVSKRLLWILPCVSCISSSWLVVDMDVQLKWKCKGWNMLYLCFHRSN